MANTYNFPPQGGNIIGSDNKIYNIVDLLGGGTPINAILYDITQFQPKCGLIVGSDNRLYDVVVLLQRLAASCGGKVTEEEIQEAVDNYLEQNPIQAGATEEQARQIAANTEAINGLKQNSAGGTSFKTDESLKLVDGILSVNSVNVVEEDNMLPITSAAVHTTVGNIEVLLQTI